MMTLRPKHSFESVVNKLASGLASGSIRLSNELKEADEPTVDMAQKPIPTSNHVANARFRA